MKTIKKIIIAVSLLMSTQVAFAQVDTAGKGNANPANPNTVPNPKGPGYTTPANPNTPSTPGTNTPGTPGYNPNGSYNQQPNMNNSKSDTTKQKPSKK